MDPSYSVTALSEVSLGHLWTPNVRASTFLSPESKSGNIFIIQMPPYRDQPPSYEEATSASNSRNVSECESQPPLERVATALDATPPSYSSSTLETLTEEPEEWLAQQGAAKPSSSQQGAAKPSSSQQGAAKPSSSQQGAAKPSSSQQGAAKPSSSQQGAVKPSSSQLGVPKTLTKL
ncbi:unnamed protein product [Cyprideis torosa]|uniref:Uncharacterized protein n=1 Tax=Cyprideis torosa TaxID=163714 RepID=A0A7R8WBM2_9CRUS|nr:unnamed protein product [Cyprideis torosa]CAG0891038.1 unnamed protein product [Cyprideis torosa]